MINVTNAAIAKIAHLVSLEANACSKLRIYISGGGCSGFQYGFKLDTEVHAADTIIDIDNISIVIENICIPYLKGATLDYVTNLQGARFKIENPNAETTCGCGDSFSLKQCHLETRN